MKNNEVKVVVQFKPTPAGEERLAEAIKLLLTSRTSNKEVHTNELLPYQSDIKRENRK